MNTLALPVVVCCGQGGATSAQHFLSGARLCNTTIIYACITISRPPKAWHLCLASGATVREAL